jgi:hypothetical protein
LRISTANERHTGPTAITRFSDPSIYEASDYKLMRRYIRRIKVGPEDVVFDIGSGKGRALCVFGRMPVRACIGIECDLRLCATAQENVRRLRGRRAPIEIRCQDAAEADYDEGTIFWLNNPFGAKTLIAVLRRIHQSIVHRPRAIKLIYIHPKHLETVRSFPWLRMVAREKPALCGISEATFWVNTPSRIERAASGLATGASVDLHRVRTALRPGPGVAEPNGVRIECESAESLENA